VLNVGIAVAVVVGSIAIAALVAIVLIPAVWMALWPLYGTIGVGSSVWAFAALVVWYRLWPGGRGFWRVWQAERERRGLQPATLSRRPRPVPA
jgi:hypothetical protein